MAQFTCGWVLYGGGGVELFNPIDDEQFLCGKFMNF